MKYAMLTLLVLFMLTSVCDAKLIKRRRRVGARAPQAWHDANDQGKCQIEAQYMFDHGIRGHVFGNIGNFEGVGWSGPGCATCTPRRGMKLTGDAQVGRYRVRSWR